MNARMDSPPGRREGRQEGTDERGKEKRGGEELRKGKKEVESGHGWSSSPQSGMGKREGKGQVSGICYAGGSWFRGIGLLCMTVPCDC